LIRFHAEHNLVTLTSEHLGLHMERRNP